jgi:hypothetical protein
VHVYRELPLLAILTEHERDQGFRAQQWNRRLDATDEQQNGRVNQKEGEALTRKKVSQRKSSGTPARTMKRKATLAGPSKGGGPGWVRSSAARRSRKESGAARRRQRRARGRRPAGGSAATDDDRFTGIARSGDYHFLRGIQNNNR